MKKTWIVLDHGKKAFCDIKWIPKHPGGAVYKKDIDANKHYENPET